MFLLNCDQYSNHAMVDHSIYSSESHVFDLVLVLYYNGINIVLSVVKPTD